MPHSNHHYAWTISARGRQDINKVTTMAELVEVLRTLNMPGIAPEELVTIDLEAFDHGTYTHDKGGEDEWSLTWTKVDGDTEVID